MAPSWKRRIRRIGGWVRPALLAAAVLCVCGGATVRAQEDPELEVMKRQLREAQEQIRKQQELIQSIQARIGELEIRRQDAETAPPEDGDPPTPVEWKNGKTTFTFSNSAFTLSNRLQVRWVDGTGEQPPFQRLSNTFQVRRFKSQLQGWVYTPQLTFKLQADWARADKILDDAYIDYDFTGGREYFLVRAGQFKIPFARQHLASTRTNMFPDRSFVTYVYAGVRDIGIMFHGRAGPEGVPDLVEWYAGLFNGEGQGVTRNVDGKYLFVTRIMVSPFGSAGYDEANPEGAEEPRLSIAAKYMNNDHRIKAEGGVTAQGFKNETVGFDLMFKWSRFTLYGEYFDRKIWDKDHLRTDSTGYVVQVGYLAILRRLEVFGRIAEYDPDDSAFEDTLWERGIACNWYFQSNENKLQFDVRWTRRLRAFLSGERTNREYRLQYQIVF